VPALRVSIDLPDIWEIAFGSRGLAPSWLHVGATGVTGALDSRPYPQVSTLTCPPPKGSPCP